MDDDQGNVTRLCLSAFLTDCSGAVNHSPNSFRGKRSASSNCFLVTHSCSRGGIANSHEFYQPNYEHKWYQWN